MATTTPNYGWDVPTSTDYVKDGATAIETLGDDIDSSLFSITGGKNVGLVHINSTTISAATQISVNSVFTSGWRNYLVIIDAREATATDIGFTMRLRASATDNTAASYDLQTNGRTGTTQYGDLVNGATSWSFQIGNRAHQLAVLQIMTPQLAMPTLVQGTVLSADMGANIGSQIQVGDHRDNYQADGFTAFFTNSTNGVARVYGYRD